MEPEVVPLNTCVNKQVLKWYLTPVTSLNESFNRGKRLPVGSPKITLSYINISRVRTLNTIENTQTCPNKPIDHVSSANSRVEK